MIASALIGTIACAEVNLGATPSPTPAPATSPAVVHEDAEGPGWRLRSDVFESVHEGVRLALPPGWRLAFEPELIADTPSGVAFIHQEHAITVQLQRLVFMPGGPDELRRAHTEPWLASTEPAPPMLVELAGHDVQLTAGVDSQRERLIGFLLTDGQASAVVASYPSTSSRELMRELVRLALARVELLTPDEQTSLRAELERSPSRWDQLGPDWSLRDATFNDFAFGVRVNIPSSVMTVVVDAALGQPNVRLSFEDRSLGLYGELIAAEFNEVTGLRKETWHEFAIADVAEELEVEQLGDPQPMALGDADALVVTLYNPRTGTRSRAATTSNDERGLVFLALSRNPAIPLDQLDQLLTAFEIADDLLQTRIIDNRYFDLAAGYAIDMPVAAQPGVTFLERDGHTESMTLWWTAGNEQMFRITIHNFGASTGPMEANKRALIERVESNDPLWSKRQWVTIEGPIPGRRFTWMSNNREFSSILFSRGRSIYELHSSSPTPGAYEQLLAGFELLD